MRHIEVRELWLQEEVRLGRVKVERINGKENPADLMTKYLRVGEVVERLRRMGLDWRRQQQDGGRRRWADEADSDEDDGGVEALEE